MRSSITRLATEFPGVDDADGVLLDFLGLRGRDDEHRDLRAFARLEIGEASLELRLLGRGKRTRQVSHTRRKRRDRLQRREQQRRRDQDGESKRVMPDHGFVSNSTVGGFEISASFSTVKFGFTW